MAEALYRKYRPATFTDIVGQEHIERTLKNAIEQNKVSHAYLFCGPRGTGKTTTARILAKALLCENGPTVNPDGTCAECEAIAQGIHPDVYELDAASRTGVDNVREEIISRVHYAPTRGKVKIYIIDEVHMLTIPAFNALLKTLEEPPSHVVFILCTTDPHKIPETIHSRCQRFDFHRISPESIIARLGTVCVSENVPFDPEALDLIARRADGGMRNALTSLEQLIAFDNGKASYEGAQNLFGGLDNSDLHDIVMAIGKRDISTCFSWTADYVEEGSDLAQFTKDLAEHTRNLYLMSVVNGAVELDVNPNMIQSMTEELAYFTPDRLSRMLTVLGELIKELRLSSNSRLAFEIALTRLVRPDSDLTLEALAERIADLEKKLAQGVPVQAAPVASAPASRPTAPAPAPVTQPVPAAQPATPAPRQTVAASQMAPTQQVASASAVSQPAPQMPVAQPVQQAAPAVPAQAAPAAPAQPAPQVMSQAAPQTAMTSSVDVTNPAALQRLWRTVTSTLRKADPTCGVLFMNARVHPNPNGQGILVEFAAESEFAYNAASKEKPQTLLAKTLDECAHGHMPYELVLSGGASSAPKPAPRPAAPAPQPAPAPMAQPAPAPMAQAAPAPQPAVSQPAQPAPAPMVQPAVPKPAPQPTFEQSAPKPMTQAAPAYYEDDVPLDVYDSYSSSVEPPAYEPAPYADFAPASVAPQPAIAPGFAPEPAPAPMPKPAPQPVASAPRPAARPAAPAQSQVTVAQAPSAQAPTFAQAPSAQTSAQTASPASSFADITDLEAMLSAGFGEGIKFEEI